MQMSNRLQFFEYLVDSVFLFTNLFEDNCVFVWQGTFRVLRRKQMLKRCDLFVYCLTSVCFV